MNDTVKELRKLSESTPNFEFTVDTSKTKLIESKDERTGEVQKRMVVEGLFSKAGAVTGNRRRYGLKVWERNLAADSPFTERLKKRKVVGMLEHPQDDPDYANVSHLFEDVQIRPNGDIWARVTVMKTPKGAILEELFTLGVPVGASSRGEGSTTLAEDGFEDVDDDYVLETWDFVHTPALAEAAASPVKESLEKGKGSKPMKESIQKAKSFLEEHKGGVAALGTTKLVETHLRAVEHLGTLSEDKDIEAAEMRGRLAEFASQLSVALTESTKSKGDKVKDEINDQYPTAIEGITAVMENLVKRNQELEEAAKKGGDPEVTKQLEDLQKRYDTAMRIGNDLVKKTRRSVAERQRLEKKYAASLALNEKIIQTIRDRDLKEKVEAVCGKLPRLGLVKEQLLACKTMKELQEKLDTFSALIEGDKKEKKTESKKPGKKKSTPRGAVRESMPSKTTEKGKRTRELAPAGLKPKSLFGKLAEREGRSTKSNRAAEVKAEREAKYPNRK